MPLCSRARRRYLPHFMITIRRAIATDQEALGRMGAALMRQHHAEDPGRFIQVERPEAGYGRFLVSLLADPDSLVMVAEDAGQVVGYVYADIEGTNWKELRGPCGYVNDVFVIEGVRRKGAGRELMRAAIDWIRSKGQTQVVLWAKTRNEHAHQLFARLGFRKTMIEMTLDLEGAGDE